MHFMRNICIISATLADRFVNLKPESAKSSVLSRYNLFASSMVSRLLSRSSTCIFFLIALEVRVEAWVRFPRQFAGYSMWQWTGWKPRPTRERQNARFPIHGWCRLPHTIKCKSVSVKKLFYWSLSSTLTIMLNRKNPLLNSVIKIPNFNIRT